MINRLFGEDLVMNIRIHTNILGIKRSSIAYKKASAKVDLIMDIGSCWGQKGVIRDSFFCNA